MKITAVLSGATGATTLVTSATLVAEQAHLWQAFWGIIFGACTLTLFAWSTWKNHKRQDEKLEELKRHNDAMEKKKDP